MSALTGRDPEPAAIGGQPPGLAEVRAAVERIWGVQLAERATDRREDRERCQARQAAMWLAREVTDQTAGQIARFFRRDRSTVLYAWGLIDRRRATDAGLRLRTDAVVAALGPREARRIAITARTAGELLATLAGRDAAAVRTGLLLARLSVGQRRDLAALLAVPPASPHPNPITEDSS